jgi:hypothetical protein
MVGWDADRFSTQPLHLPNLTSRKHDQQGARSRWNRPGIWPLSLCKIVVCWEIVAVEAAESVVLLDGLVAGHLRRD